MGVDDDLRAIANADDRARERKHVTIIGAGMAGLTAALELEALGHTVRIFDAGDRPGGRAWTHRFADGSYGELGPMRVPQHHDYTHHYIRRCGLELRRFVTAHENLSCFYDIRGVRVRMRDAREQLYPHFDLSPQQREDEVPPKMLARAVGDVVEGLTDQVTETVDGVVAAVVPPVTVPKLPVDLPVTVPPITVPKLPSRLHWSASRAPPPPASGRQSRR